MSLTEEQVAEMIKENVARILAEERAARPVANPSPKVGTSDCFAVALLTLL